MHIKRPFLLLIACLFFSYLRAQTGVVFKIKYLPEHSYETNITTNMNAEMNISGDEKEMEKIKAKGIKLPMIMTSVTTVGVNIKTGALKPGSTFPITLNYADLATKKTLNGKETTAAPSPLIGQTIYGECTSAGKMHLDSMSGKALDENLKASLTSAINNMVNQMHFPEKPLNIGETFTQEVPFNLPISGINMQFAIKIIYRLTTIENNSAFFDLDQSMSFDMATKKDSVTMTGKGTGKGDGKLIYSIEQNFPTSMSSNFDLSYQIKVENMTMTGRAKTSSTHQTKISSIAK